MEAIVYLKQKSKVSTFVSSQNEEVRKITVVLSQKECRTGDSGVYAVDNDLVFDILGDRVPLFENLQPGTWMTISYSTVARPYNETWYGENRLTRFALLQ